MILPHWPIYANAKNYGFMWTARDPFVEVKRERVDAFDSSKTRRDVGSQHGQQHRKLHVSVRQTPTRKTADESARFAPG
jgi:hypothetical protein